MSADEGVADITQLEEEEEDNEVTSNGVSTTTTTTKCASRELIPSALLITSPVSVLLTDVSICVTLHTTHPRKLTTIVTFPSVCNTHRCLHLYQTTHHTPTQINRHRLDLSRSHIHAPAR
jgi:hypothetical protein